MGHCIHDWEVEEDTAICAKCDAIQIDDYYEDPDDARDRWLEDRMCV